MNAAEFLKSRRTKAPTHPVKVRLFSKEDGGSFADADAVLVFVPDADRLRADDDATKALVASGVPASPERRAAEETHHLLARALRCANDPALVFFDSVDACKAALLDDEALKLRNEYERFKNTHFPPSISNEEIAAIKEAAAGYFLPALLTQFGYWQILRALPSLAASYGAPLTWRS